MRFAGMCRTDHAGCGCSSHLVASACASPSCLALVTAARLLLYPVRMIVGEATATVAVPPSEVFEFVLDLNRYRQADRKIGRVGAIHRTGDTGTVRFSGRIKGLPGPAGTYPFT